MDAETVYLFRHALLRDAAYQLQLPGDRAKLHALAFEILERIHGGRAPLPKALNAARMHAYTPHPSDVVAQELADHLRAAMTGVQGPTKLPLWQRLMQRYLRQAAEYAERQFRLEAAASAWLELAGTLRGEPSAVALLRAANAAHKSGNWERAKAHAEGAIAKFRHLGIELGITRSMSSLCVALNSGGQWKVAEAAAREGLKLAKDLGKRHEQAIFWDTLGNNYQQSGRTAEAESAYLKALALHRQCNDLDFAGSTLGNLAMVYQVTHRLSEAERTYALALEHNLAAGNIRSAGIVLANCADLLLETGNTGQAESACNRALALARESGNRRTLGVALGNLANVYRLTSRLVLAEKSFEQAIDIHREVRNRFAEASHQCDSAYCILALGRVEEARSRWRLGISLLVEIRAKGEAQRQRATMLAECAKAEVPAFE